MVLLLMLAFLFAAGCMVAGAAISSLVVGNAVTHPPLILQWLTGYAALAVWCNVWSLWRPVNEWCLVSLLVIILLLVTIKAVQTQLTMAGQSLAVLIQPGALWFTVPVALVWLIYTILTPQHGDSPGYHYSTIRWINQYAVVPGLANLHGRFGFNSSFFTVSAAFSLHRWTGQAVYPVNIGIAAVWLGWLLRRMVAHAGAMRWVYIVLLFLIFRGIILTISSPTPDISTAMLQFFLFWGIGKSIIQQKKHPPAIALCWILTGLFAITIKLSCLFALPVLLLLWPAVRRAGTGFWVRLLAGSCLLALPWVVRNYVLTGYLAYPVAATGFLQPDWQVPYEVLHFDRLLIRNGPRLVGTQWETIDRMAIWEWLPGWIRGNIQTGQAASLVLLCCTLAAVGVSMVYWFRLRRMAPTLLFAVNLLVILMWLYTSPDYRFGYGYLLAGLALAGYAWLSNAVNSQWLTKTPALVCALVCLHYLHFASPLLRGYSLQQYWCTPWPPRTLQQTAITEGFQTQKLAGSITLYIEDPQHDCNAAPLPCFPLFFQQLDPHRLQLRGNAVQEGFRMAD